MNVKKHVQRAALGLMLVIVTISLWLTWRVLKREQINVALLKAI